MNITAMTIRRRVVPLTLLALVIGAIVGLIMTRPDGQPATSTRRSNNLVDQRPLQTARNVSALASTREEVRYARQALRIADHAVDLAFSIEFRKAAAQPTDPKSREALARLNQFQAQVKVDQAKVDELKKSLSSAGVMEQDTFQQQLNLMQAQLELDQDEMEDAQEDVRRAGNNAGRLQRLFERHQADEQHQNEQAQNTQYKPEVDYGEGSLSKQFATWRGLSDKQNQLGQAGNDALKAADGLTQEINGLQQKVAVEEGASSRWRRLPQLCGQTAQLPRAARQRRRLLLPCTNCPLIRKTLATKPNRFATIRNSPIPIPVGQRSFRDRSRVPCMACSARFCLSS